MTATFADYAAQQDARNTIQLNVTKWTLMLCDALKDNAPDGYDYIIESGRKYHKVIMCINGRRDSIHALIDKKTGSVYKPASLRGPAKGERCNLLIIEEREWALSNADWAGSWLYLR